MILIVMFIVFLSVLATSVHSVNLAKVRATRERVESDQAQIIASSGFQYAVLRLWDEYLVANGGVPGSYLDYRGYVENSFNLVDGGEIDLGGQDWPAFAAGELVSVSVE